MRTDMFQQILDDLNSSSADVEASALISTDGLMIASALPSGIDEDRVGAVPPYCLWATVQALNWLVVRLTVCSYKAKKAMSS